MPEDMNTRDWWESEPAPRPKVDERAVPLTWWDAMWRKVGMNYNSPCPCCTNGVMRITQRKQRRAA